MRKSQTLSPIFTKIVHLMLVMLIISGCAAEATTSPGPNPTAEVVAPNNDVLAQVTFEVVAPAQTPTGQSVYIDILDEVTGLALNPARYRMEAKGSNTYTFKIPVAVGSILKYRYGREGTPPLVEYSPNGKQVRYRLLQVQAPTQVNDIIGGWIDQPYSGKFGRLTGQILDVRTNAPVPNIMVTAGGVQTFSSADGTYLIEGLPMGVHNVVAHSLDGAYETYQQGAQIGSDTTTPAVLRLLPAQLVSVTFITHAPTDSVRGLPIRMIGNILSMGNTFADLGGGISTVASRAPLMMMLSDGRYSLTLSLPVGLDLRYKYSAGDGFWNAEHNQDGSFNVRQFIIPNKNVTVEDTINSWQTKDIAPVTFTVTVPTNTPTNDTVSIQLNPFGWTEPIPMWPLGNRQWLFVLYSPLQLVSKVSYRYCRNDQCGIADDSNTAGGAVAVAQTFSPGSVALNMQDEVKQWAWISSEAAPAPAISVQVQARGSTFMAGVEMQPKYQPDWQPYISWGFDHMVQMGANWVVIDPTWSATRVNPPVLEPVSGRDAYWQDLVQMIVWAQDKDLSIALFPTLNLDPSEDTWWTAAQRDANWWNAWFDRYRSFILHHADLAAQVNAGTLILGEPRVAPSLPNGKLANGISANPPADADKRWRGLIVDVRARYKGKIAWALPYSGGVPAIPSFIGDADSIYMLWSVPLARAANAEPAELSATMGKVLDQEILKLKNKVDKPLILGINYPSISGASLGCAQIGTKCYAFDSLLADAKVTSNLAEQAAIYNAVMSSVNQRSWINGVVSRGFYPPAVLQDYMPSIHGKPAAEVLRYYYPRFLAPVK